MTEGERADHPTDDALALAGSPRGLAVLATMCGEDLDLRSPTGPPSTELASPRLGAGLRRWYADPEHGGLVAEDRAHEVLDDPVNLTVEVLGIVDGMAWRPDRSRLGELARHDTVFRPAASDLLAVRGSRWWPDDVDREDQVILGPPDGPPDLAALAAEQDRLLCLPWRVPQALTTSQRLDARLPSVRLGASEAFARWSGDVVGCWALQVDPGARILEIHRADDWRQLCARYPHRGATPVDYERWGVTSPEAVAPDWALVGCDWDAVHISMLGLLTAVGVPISVGAAGGVLEDIDSELTAWLRPCLGEPRLIARRSPEDLLV